MPITIKAPAGGNIDVNALAEADPEDAFLLLSEEAQDEVESKLSPGVYQELGELIVLLADVIGKSAESYPLVRIDVLDATTGDDIRSTVTVERSAETVYKRTTENVIGATVAGLKGLWEDACAKEPTSAGKYTISMSFLLALTDLVRTITHDIPSHDSLDKLTK